MIDGAQSPFPDIDSKVLQALVIEAAGRVFTGSVRCDVHQKQDGSLVTQFDIRLQELLYEMLQQRWPEIPLLGEEMDPAGQRRVMSSDSFWCLDPLDGTTNFANGIPFYAISLALVRKGVVISGVVYDPSHNECFRADRGAGAWLNDQPLRLCAGQTVLAQSIALVDIKRLPGPLISRIASAMPFRSQRSLGAVALEWCWLAAGRVQLYLHGAQRLWDYAAGLLVFREAGGCGCIMELVSGDCLESDRDLEAHAAIGACEPGLLKQWRAWLYADGQD